MSAQIIEKNGKAEFAVVPIDEYNLLLEKAEELDDVTAFDKAMHELFSGRVRVMTVSTTFNCRLVNNFC